MKIRIVTARREWNCSSLYWSPGSGSTDTPRRALDGGEIPPDHTPRIEIGSRFAQFQMYGETQRMCEACSRAAGVMS